jgi:hypothetical protein
MALIHVIDTLSTLNILVYTKIGVQNLSSKQEDE